MSRKIFSFLACGLFFCFTSFSFAENEVYDAALNIAQQLAMKYKKIDGKVLFVKNKHVYFDQGANSGINENDELQVIKSDADVIVEGKRYAGLEVVIGRIIVSHIDKDYSYGLFSPSIDIAEGDQSLPRKSDKVVRKTVPVTVAIIAINGQTLGKHKNIANDFINELSDIFARSKTFNLVDRANVEQVLKEINFSASGLVRSQDIIKLGQMTKADYLVSGEMVKINNSTLSIVVNMRKSSTAEITDSAKTVLPLQADQCCCEMKTYQAVTTPSGHTEWQKISGSIMWIDVSQCNISRSLDSGREKSEQKCVKSSVCGY